MYEEEFTSDADISSVFCDHCQSYFYPENLINQYICVKDTELELLNITEDNIVQNCVKVDESGECMQCSDSHFLNFEDKQCVLSCP